MSKEQGEMVEILFHLEAFHRNMIVCKPFGDNKRYDFIVDSGHGLSKVQVKSTSVKDTKTRNDRYRIVSAHRANTKNPYTLLDIDLLVAYVIPEHAWYIIPIHEISNSTGIYLRPHITNYENQRFEQYREMWELF